MNDRVFLDTNILVYAYDQHDPKKQTKAQGLLTDGIKQENLFLSVQVLGEFFNVVTRHIPQPMPPRRSQGDHQYAQYPTCSGYRYDDG